jgi:hypothetical protein
VCFSVLNSVLPRIVKSSTRRLPQLRTRHRSIPPVFMGFVARRLAEKIIAQIL